MPSMSAPGRPEQGPVAWRNEPSPLRSMGEGWPLAAPASESAASTAPRRGRWHNVGMLVAIQKPAAPMLMAVGALLASPTPAVIETASGGESGRSRCGRCPHHQHWRGHGGRRSPVACAACQYGPRRAGRQGGLVRQECALASRARLTAPCGGRPRRSGPTRTVGLTAVRETILIETHRTRKLLEMESQITVAVLVLPWVRPR